MVYILHSSLSEQLAEVCSEELPVCLWLWIVWPLDSLAEQRNSYMQLNHDFVSLNVVV